MTPESKVKQKVVNILKFHNAWYCFPATHGRGRSGIPDILVSHRGAFIGIEVKRDAKHLPTKLQEHELFKIQESGSWACVIHAGNLLELEGLMTTITTMAELTRLQGHDMLTEATVKAESEGTEPGDKRHLPKPGDTLN